MEFSTNRQHQFIVVARNAGPAGAVRGRRRVQHAVDEEHILFVGLLPAASPCAGCAGVSGAGAARACAWQRAGLGAKSTKQCSAAWRSSPRACAVQKRCRAAKNRARWQSLRSCGQAAVPAPCFLVCYWTLGAYEAAIGSSPQAAQIGGRRSSAHSSLIARSPRAASRSRTAEGLHLE